MILAEEELQMNSDSSDIHEANRLDTECDNSSPIMDWEDVDDMDDQILE